MRDPVTVANELAGTLQRIHDLRGLAEKKGVHRMTPKQIMDFNASASQLVKRKQQLERELNEMLDEVNRKLDTCGPFAPSEIDAWQKVSEILTPYREQE